MRRSEAATVLLVATLTLVTLASPGTAATPDPVIEPAPVASADATDVLEDAEAVLAGDLSESSDEPGQPVDSPSVALAELVSVYPELSEREQVQADALLARPDEPGNGVDIKTWTVEEANPPECGDHVCVHFVTSTSDSATRAWASRNMEIFEEVWAYEVDTLGYRAPAGDGARGGNAKFDVYLANIGIDGYYGYCAPEGRVANQDRRRFAYCVLDNDFADFVGTPPDNLKVTAAHEFFHAIQYNYDVAEDKWIMEATATWMEERYADSVNDSRQYLKFGQMGKPSIPMDTFGGLTHYGNWSFFERLTKKYGVGAMRSIWRRLDANKGAPDQYSIQAVKNFLMAHGTTLPKFYANYAAGNLAPARAYTEGSAYKPTKFNDSFKLKQSHRAIAPHKARLKHLSSKSYRFKSTDSLPSKAKLKITIDGPAKNTAPAAVAYVYFKSGKLTKKFIKLNRAGDGSARMKFSPGKVKRVNLTLVNASTRFVCWASGSYSCDGFSRDNSSRFTFSAKVVG